MKVLPPECLEFLAIAMNGSTVPILIQKKKRKKSSRERLSLAIWSRREADIETIIETLN